MAHTPEVEFVDPFQTVEVLPDLLLPRRLDSGWIPLSGGRSARLTALFSLIDLAYRVESLEIRGDSAPITTAALRAVAVQDLLRRSVERASVGRREDESARGPARDHDLLEVARVYALARALNEPPLKAVAVDRGVSQSTATRLVAKAHSLGLLERPDRGLSHSPTSYRDWQRSVGGEPESDG